MLKRAQKVIEGGEAWFANFDRAPRIQFPGISQGPRGGRGARRFL